MSKSVSGSNLFELSFSQVGGVGGFSQVTVYFGLIHSPDSWYDLSVVSRSLIFSFRWWLSVLREIFSLSKILISSFGLWFADLSCCIMLKMSDPALTLLVNKVYSASHIFLNSCWYPLLLCVSAAVDWCLLEYLGIPQNTLHFTLIKLVKFLKRGKAPGNNTIHNEVLRLGTTTSLFHRLARLFTSSIQLGYIPTAWKIATLHMLLKPDKLPSLTTSYRPISLISSIMKLFERVIEQKLRSHLEHI